MQFFVIWRTVKNEEICNHSGLCGDFNDYQRNFTINVAFFEQRDDCRLFCDVWHSFSDIEEKGMALDFFGRFGGIHGTYRSK